MKYQYVITILQVVQKRKSSHNPARFQWQEFKGLLGWCPNFPYQFLAAYAKILVAYGILPTLLTLPSQILPIFWPTWGQGFPNQNFG
jgi:hypothetical protein